MATSTALGYNPSPLFNIGTGFANAVYATSIQSDEKILVGGVFSSFNASSQNRLIRLNSDGPKDTTFNIGTGFNGIVYSTSIQSDGKALIGGSFTAFTGSAQAYLIRLNSDGSKDTTFDIGSGFNTYVRDLSIQSDGKILAVGDFTTFTGSTQNKIIRLNSDGSKDTTFEVGTAFGGGINVIRTVSIQTDGKILVGGDFTSYSGITSRKLIRLNSNGSKDTTFDIGSGFDDSVSFSVYSTSIQSDGKVLAGGSFTGFTGSVENRLIRLNSNGSKDTTFNIGEGFNSTVFSIKIQSDGKILVGGNFTTFSGSSQNRAIRLNSDGSKDTTFDIGTGFGSTVRSISIQSDGKILVGGDFLTFAGSSQNRLIRLNSDGSKNSSITGTTQVGSFSVVTGSTIGPTSNVTFWMGPDEDPGYVIGVPVSGGTQTTPISGVNAFLGFYRSTEKTEASFVSLVNQTFNQSFSTGATAKTYLTNNSYWTSYVPDGSDVTPNPTPNWENATADAIGISVFSAMIQIAGITQNITFSISFTPTVAVDYFAYSNGTSSIFGNNTVTQLTTSPTSITVAPNNYLGFNLVSSYSTTRTITITNISDNNTVLDTFTLTTTFDE